MKRFLTGSLMAAAMGLGVGAAGHAASYPPEPALDVQGFSTICIEDAPFIQYNIILVGQDWPGQAILRIFDVRGDQVGDDEIVTEPEGTMIYPGAEIDPVTGEAIDWPGWVLNEDGFWVEDPSDAFLREGLTIEVEVNPTATATVTYPPESSECASPPEVEQFPPPTTTTTTTLPPGTPQRPTTRPPLPAAGASGLEMITRLGALAMVAGLGFVIATRRRRFSVDHDA